MRRLRTRVAIALVLVGAAACSFGVDLDNLIDGPRGGDEAGIPETSTADVTSLAEGGSETGPPSIDLLQIGAGNGFTCVRKVDRTVACWGRGSEGRLGNGGALSSSTPTTVVDIDDAIDLNVGLNHACVVRAAGTVYCWGANESRQLGLAATTPPSEARTPQPVAGIANATQVAAGGAFTCALLADKTVSCWGSNAEGQIGDGTIVLRPAPTAVKNLTDVKQVGVGLFSACALTTTGDVWCWGDNADGQSGSGDAGGMDLTTPRKIETLTGVTSLSSSGAADHFCATLPSGEARCWGFGEQGCLGNGTLVDSAIPVAPTTPNDVTSIATGNAFTCAVRTGGKVSCFGSNFWRVLPVANAPATASLPLESALTGVDLIAGGSSHACAIVNKRSVQCWGTDQFGALGRARPIVFETPTLVRSDTKFAAVAAGRDFTCALDAPDGGNLSCWGLNTSRQHARTDYVISGKPAVVPGITGVSRVAPAEVHTCALVTDGGVRCWGNGDSAALGFPASVQTTPGVFVAPPAADVGTGASFSCALLRSRQVMCAGSSTNGQLGRSGTSSTTPQLVSADGGGAGSTFEGIDALSVGRGHACVLHSGRQKLACWGSNSEGQLGTGGSSRALALDVTLPARPLHVQTGARHTCVIVDSTDAGTSGDVHCFGSNTSFQLSGNLGGNGIRLVPLSKRATMLALGDDHSCALLVDGTVACWGAGTSGQLGNGARVESKEPVVVSGVTGATSIVAEESHTCAVTPAGLFCWGTDLAGQAGVDSVIIDNLPAPVSGL